MVPLLLALRPAVFPCGAWKVSSHVLLLASVWAALLRRALGGSATEMDNKELMPSEGGFVPGDPHANHTIGLSVKPQGCGLSTRAQPPPPGPSAWLRPRLLFISSPVWQVACAFSLLPVVTGCLPGRGQQPEPLQAEGMLLGGSHQPLSQDALANRQRLDPL